MIVKLTNRTVDALKPQNKTYDVRDTDITGFLVRVRPSGSMTYLLQYRNKDGVQKHFKIGLVGNIKPAPARDKAEIEAGRVAQGIDIQEVRKAERVEAMRSIPMSEWVQLLRTHGPMTMHAVTNSLAGGHVRILYGVIGDGTLSGSKMLIIDPWNGRKYQEPYEKFLAKYEGGGAQAGRTGQIAHW